MEQVSRRVDTNHNDNHLRNFQNNLQPRHPSDDDIQYESIDVTFKNLILPITFLGITFLAIIFVLLILFIWWHNIKTTWKLKKSRCDAMVRTMAEYSPESSNFKIEIIKNDEVKPKIQFVDESQNRLVVVTARNYGGSSPKLPDEKPSTSKDEKKEDKFVFPPQTVKDESEKEVKIPKLPLPEQQWLQTHKTSLRFKGTIPRPLVEIVKSEIDDKCSGGGGTNKKFSVTRSPSLEKDDKSPFMSGSKSEKEDMFGFDGEVFPKANTDTNETCLQPQAENQRGFDRNFNHNVKHIVSSPDASNIPKNIWIDNGSEECSTNLRRFISVNTKLNICCENENPIEKQQENLEMQNSPGAIECNSAKEKSSASKFNFSPKLLSENKNSPQFFTPTDKFSPRFFAEPSPRSVYYDSVRSPKFFPSTPRSPNSTVETEKPMSPKPFSEQTQNNGSLERQNSPRILLSKLSPKVSNKENYFSFDSKSTDLCSQKIKEDPEITLRRSPRSPRHSRYGGRKSIERERITATEKVDVRKYRRHNSCETNYGNYENSNPISSGVKTDQVAKDTCYIDEIMNDNEQASDYQNNSNVNENEGADVVDCTIQMQRLSVEPIEEDIICKETPLHIPHTAQERRQRLKSISLDSDNAKIIEQNLGIPVAKQLKEQLESYKDLEFSASCENVVRSDVPLNFDTTSVEQKFKFSPTLQKKTLRDSSDPSSFIDMPRFSPKEFEFNVISDEAIHTPKKRHTKNPRNLTIDLTKHDSDLEKEILEFEKLYTCSEDKKPKTPTLKVKATSLDSSDSHLSIPKQKELEVPQNSVSVPNTPKRQFKRLLCNKNLAKGNETYSGGKLGYSSLQCPIDRRSLMKDSSGYFRENALSIYQPSVSRTSSRTMGSFDENMADFAENPEINVEPDDSNDKTHLDTLGFKPNLSVSSTNLKTLPEGVPSTDFEPSIDDKFLKKLNRRGSNQMLILDSKYSLQSSNCSLNSVGASSSNLASIRNSASNFSLNTDNRQRKLTLERRCSNVSINSELAPPNRVMSSSSSNFQISGSNPDPPQPLNKTCLLQRRGSNNSLTLNIQCSSGHLSRYSSNSSLNINKEVKTNQRKGLLERRSSNTSLTLNINSSNPQLGVNRSLSISNYNINASNCNLNRYNSNQSINNPTEPKKGILERRSSNTSLTLNLQPNDMPRDIEIDEKLLNQSLKDNYPHRDKHRKSLSTENLIPKSYKNRLKLLKDSDNQIAFGSHDDLWSESYATENPDFQDHQNLTYVCGDQENEMIYAFGAREIDETNFSGGFIRNITTKPLSPQTTSEDFKLYLANIQHLQNASSILSRQQLKDLNNVFQNGYSKVKCEVSSDSQHKCCGLVEQDNARTEVSDSIPPCSEYQKALLRNLHQEFWDLPTNFQEKALIFGSHPKNRYKSILPNEHSRVILQDCGSDSLEGYINANFIKGHEYSKNCYIATQAPMQNTIYDFWVMVKQNTNKFIEINQSTYKECKSDNSFQKKEILVQKVVMLTNFIENNNQKCDKYFPLEINEEVVFTNPQLQSNILVVNDKDLPQKCKQCVCIKNSGIIHKTGYTIRRLEVIFKENSVENEGKEEAMPKESVKSTKCEKEVKRSEALLAELETDKIKSKNDSVISSENINYIDDFEDNIEITKHCESATKSNENCIRSDINDINELSFSKFYNEIRKNTQRNENFLKDKSECDNKNICMNEDEIIVVYHYWFHNWADHKCPKDVKSLLNLSLDILEDTVYDFDNPSNKFIDPECVCTVTPKTTPTKFVFPPLDDSVGENICVANTDLRVTNIKNDLNSPPTVIHCSAGIGRTGCLIAILNGIKQLNYDNKVDILGIVCNMRLNRGGMVQNSEQYELIHKVLCLYEQTCLPGL